MIDGYLGSPTGVPIEVQGDRLVVSAQSVVPFQRAGASTGAPPSSVNPADWGGTCRDFLAADASAQAATIIALEGKPLNDVTKANLLALCRKQPNALVGGLVHAAKFVPVGSAVGAAP